MMPPARHGPIMPDLCRRSRLTRHDVWSAVASLAAIGVSVERVVLEYAGAGWDPGSIVRQTPEAGSIVRDSTRIVLSIGGTGTLESLPYPLRQESESGEVRVDRVCAVLDGPMIRAAAHLRSAGGRYRLTPGATRTARRWIEDVMQMSAAEWPEAYWYRVARFLSSLPLIAGRHDAISTALGFVFGLPVSRVDVETGRLPMEQSLATRLQVRNGRLGIDAVAGDGIRWARTLKVSIGPVSLDAYLAQRELHHGRSALYRLVMPAYLPGGVTERWIVQDRAEGYRLGARDAAPLLGVSSYLG